MAERRNHITDRRCINGAERRKREPRELYHQHGSGRCRNSPPGGAEFRRRSLLTCALSAGRACMLTMFCSAFT
ncbi:hypothetical protein KCP69_10010 [Salmonella enterica subsp. enterica]|nr:hypothetical protein KCP69_10010 [Salmonella enterica subsp. enterica]